MTDKPFVERLSDRWALIFDHSSDALEMRNHLRDNACAPRRQVQVARVHSVPVPSPHGHGRIRVRIYEPLNARSGPGTHHGAPLIVYFHGGGFVLRDPSSQDADCRHLAHGVGALVAAVDYRLAPQNRFPAALDDAWAATRWAADLARQLGCDPTRLVIAGEGAGGNLAAGVCLLARDRNGPPIAFQLLICPVVDQRHHRAPSHPHPKHAVITDEHLRWFSSQYLGADDERLNPLVSPILADLAALPPTHLVIAQTDPLRTDQERFAQLLREAGVPTTARIYPDMFHGFFTLTDRLASAERANADVHATLRDALH